MPLSMVPTALILPFAIAEKAGVALGSLQIEMLREPYVFTRI